MIDPVLLQLPKAMSKLFDLFLTAFDTPPLVAISLVKKKKDCPLSVFSQKQIMGLPSSVCQKGCLGTPEPQERFRGKHYLYSPTHTHTLPKHRLSHPLTGNESGTRELEKGQR